MQYLLAAWIVAASIYHSHIDRKHGARMPIREATDIANASIAHPLYEGQDGPIRTAALLIIFSAHESLHTNPAPYQDTDRILRGGPFGTTSPYTPQHALSDLAWSRAACPAHPWAQYAGGCRYGQAQAISDARQAQADALLRASGITATDSTTP